MTKALLYWNHICVLHKQEKAFLTKLTEELRNFDIDLEVRYFGLGYPEHMSEYLARPDAVLPDMIVSADLEVFEDQRIFEKFSSSLYPAAHWIPLRQSKALDTVWRCDELLPFQSIPLVYYTKEPERCAETYLSGWDGLAIGGINNSAIKSVIKTVWSMYGKEYADKLLSESFVADMPIGAFQAVRQGRAETALVPSIYALRADGKNTFLCLPKEGPVLVPSYLCVRNTIPEDVAKKITESLACKELCQFYAENGDLILYPECNEKRSHQIHDSYCYPSKEWFDEVTSEEFYQLYCSRLSTAKDLFSNVSQ